MLEELRAQFDDAELAEIGSNRVRLSESIALDAIELAVAWVAEVRKIDLDRALPWSDRTVWNEHDLAACCSRAIVWVEA